MTDMQPEYRIPNAASVREEFKKKNPPLAGPSYGALRAGNSEGLSIEEQQARRKREIVASQLGQLGNNREAAASISQPLYEVMYDQEGRMYPRLCNGE